MKLYEIDNMKKLLITLLVLAVAYTGYFAVYPQIVNAGVGDNVDGWMWSDTIGWISLNCTNHGCGSGVNYGLTLNPSTGRLSGFGWSSNIGWVSFNAIHTSSMGEPRIVDYTTGRMTGFARACSGAANPSSCNDSGPIGPENNGGWDGWISLSGINFPSPDVSGNNGTTFISALGLEGIIGHAFGYNVLGWLSFEDVDVDFATDLLLTALPSALEATESTTTLTWSTPTSTDFVSCVASSLPSTPTWGSAISPTPPTTVASSHFLSGIEVPATSVTYTLVCQTLVGTTATATAVVTRVTSLSPNLSLTALPNPASFATLPEEQTTTLRWENASPSITYTTCRADDSVTDIDATTWLSFDTLDAPGFGGGEQKENIEVPNNPTTFGIQCLRTGSPIIYDEANVTVGKSTEPAPTVELTYNNFFPSTSSTIDLSYDSANADKCYADWKEGSIGAFPNPSFIVPTANDDTVLDSDVPFVTLPRTFKIICTNSAGNDSDELTVGINSPPSSGGIAPIYIEI